MIKKIKGLFSKIRMRFGSYSKKRRRITVVIIIAVLILGSFIVLKSMGSAELPGNQVNVGAVSMEDLEEIVSVAGFIEGAESADVVSQINSEIISIHVAPGDQVKKGQTLAVLDGADLREEVQLAETQYEMAAATLQAELDRAQKDYEDASRSMAEAKRKYDANKLLYQEGAISREEFITSENAYKSSTASMTTFTVTNGKVTASPSQAKSLEMERELLAQKRAQLEKVTIISPIDGTVTRVNARLGRYASDTVDEKAMFVIEDLANMQVKVLISEYDIGRLEIGQTVRISSEVLGDETVLGKVAVISPTGEQKSISQTEMVIPVRIDITGANPKLIAGVSAKARIEIAKVSNVLSVPLEAILEDPDDGSLQVFTASAEGILKAVPVKTGVEGDFMIEITSGELKEGDQVVLNPLTTYEDGMQVIVSKE